MSKNKVSMKALDISAHNAYNVTVTAEYGEPVTLAVWTNEQGNGLWINDVQVEGTSQFHTNNHGVAAAMRRYFKQYPA